MLGCTLFTRNSRGITLTSEGRMLYSYASKAVSLITAAEDRLNRMRTLQSGGLMIGASDTLCQFFLLPFLERFHTEYPEVQLQYHVSNPKDFGVVEFDDKNNVVSIEEKPEKPKSNYAVPGLYFYDNDVIAISKSLKPSARGELEITAVNNEYLKRGNLKVELFGRGMAWLDTGTPSGLLNAANFVEAVQTRQGLYIACIEEIAYRKGFIDKEQLIEIAHTMEKTDYGRYLLQIVNTYDQGLQEAAAASD
jgi:dTDP-glucose pyrophosphorylase